MGNDSWDMFNRLRWNAANFGITLSEDELLKLGEEKLSNAGDAETRATWSKVKEIAEAAGESLGKVCDEFIEGSSQVTQMLSLPKFTRPDDVASARDKAHVKKAVEKLRQDPPRYVEALEWLIFNCKDLALINEGNGFCDILDRDGRTAQSTFCAAVLESIKRHRVRGHPK